MSRPRVSLGAGYLAARARGAASGPLPRDLGALLQAARQAPIPAAYEPEYSALAPRFGHAHYFGRYPDTARARLDGIAHYMRAGAATGHDPVPFFSGAAYLRHVPEAAGSGLTPFGHWITAGGAARETAITCATDTDFRALAPLFGVTPGALFDQLTAREAALRADLAEGTLGEMARRAATLEPLIAAGWGEALAPRLLPFANEEVLGRILALHDLQAAAGWRTARAVLVTAEPCRVMETRAAALATALAEVVPPREIVVLRLRQAPPSPGAWDALLARGLRCLSLPPALPPQEASRHRVVVEFLRSLAPDHAIFEASGAGGEAVWALLEAHGRQLAEAMATVAWLPDDMDEAALSARFYRHADALAAVWLASPRAEAELAARFLVPEASRPALASFPPAHLLAAAPPARSTPRLAARAPRLLSPETEDVASVVASLGAEVPVTLLLDSAGAQRRLKYFPETLEIAVSGEQGHAAALETATHWLSPGGDAALLPFMAARGMEIIATEAACRAAGLDPAECWCPPAGRADAEALAAACRAALAGPPRTPQAPRADLGAALARCLAALPRRAPDTPTVIPATPAGADTEGPLLTVALTAHGEGHVAGPTLRSVARALEVFAADHDGAEVEILVGFDSPTPACRAYFEAVLPGLLPAARRLDVAFRDQGRTRNALAAEARGRFFAPVDADDLVSENWFSDAATLLLTREAHGTPTIAHPEVNWQFDGVERIYSNPDQESPLFSPHAMAVMNYYDAMCMAPLRLWHALPYAARDLAAGFALEDYQWFVEATARGWRHANVPGTVIFKRRRDASQHRDSRRAGALIRQVPALRIDRVRGLGRE
ncbi:MAG: glycosyltransferase family A protein [Pseudomonadota bacterium]